MAILRVPEPPFRVPRAAIGLPTGGPREVSALFVKGRRQIAGRMAAFHSRSRRRGVGALNTDAEAELFKKIPDYDQFNAMRNANDTFIVIAIRSIGEMASKTPTAQYISRPGCDANGLCGARHW